MGRGGSWPSPTTAPATSGSSPPPTPSSGPADWREVVPHRPGVRVEDVDAFSSALVLSERAEAETRVRVLPLAEGGDPFGGDLLGSGWIVPSIDSPSATWLGANPEPDAPVLRIGRTSLVTPSSVLQVGLADREETLLKQEPVLGDFDPESLRHLPRLGRRPRRDARADFGRAPPGARAPRTVRALRLRRLRDLHRPVLLAPPPLAARPWRRLRHRARARRRGDGARLVRGRQDGAQGEHVLRLRRLRTPPRGRRDRPGRTRWPAAAARPGAC